MSSKILDHLDKNNLHHAYLIEGAREEIMPEIIEFVESLGIKTSGNPDFCQILIDNFKIEEALNLRSMGNEKGFSSGKKIFIVCSNSFTLDAQGTLLKMFEEPIENTHFFLVVSDINALLKTLVSRFYLISSRQDLVEETKEAEKFIKMSLQSRIDFIKELLPKKDEEASIEDGEDISKDSNRSKALNFLNALESVMYEKFLKNYAGSSLPGVPGGSHTVHNFSETFFEHLFKVRKFLRQPGSSTKSLMESVALVIPNF